MAWHVLAFCKESQPLSLMPLPIWSIFIPASSQAGTLIPGLLSQLPDSSAAGCIHCVCCLQLHVCVAASGSLHGSLVGLWPSASAGAFCTWPILKSCALAWEGTLVATAMAFNAYMPHASPC